MTQPILIGVSACLLGEHVRYDGGHKHDRYITDILGKYFAFVPVCPEVGCGLPTPREAMRLEGDPDAPRLMTGKTRVDKSEQLMAHSPQIYREMGRLVAHGAELNLSDLLQRYEELFMKGLAFHATVKKNTNVLQHIMGYFKQQLSAAEKVELLDVIGQYHDGLLPLIVPMTLLKHCINKYDQQYLKGQVYLAPHPAQLMLRNHV